MELKKCNVKVRCEVGECRAFADWTVKTKRAGLRNAIHFCERCLDDLVGLATQRNADKNAGLAKKSEISAEDTQNEKTGGRRKQK